MRKKLFQIMAISVISILILIIVLSSSFTIVYGKFSSGNIGIIDVNLSKEYDKVIVNKSKFKKYQSVKTHGDELVEFARNIGYEGTIYYYEAINDNGKIDSTSLIEGLEWLKKQNITYINISLSSKYKSTEIESWIKDNPEIKLFSSYSNKLNTLLDYPAMYDGVIGVGSGNEINYKEEDKKYTSRRIMKISSEKGIYIVEGNSFLSLLELLRSR